MLFFYACIFFYCDQFCVFSCVFFVSYLLFVCAYITQNKKIKIKPKIKIKKNKKNKKTQIKKVLGCFRSRNVNKIYVVISDEYLGMINYYLNFHNNNNSPNDNSNSNGTNNGNNNCNNGGNSSNSTQTTQNGGNNNNSGNSASSNNDKSGNHSDNHNRNSSNSDSNVSKQNIMDVIGCTPYNFVLNIKPGLDVTRIDNSWRINGFYTPYLPIVYLQINIKHFTVNRITPIVVPGFVFFFNRQKCRHRLRVCCVC